MMEKVYTIEDIREIQKVQDYKFIGLNTPEGKEVIKQNASTVKPGVKLDKIETRLQAPKFKDGYYVVYCRSHHSSEPDNYLICKGEIKNLAEPPTPPTPAATPSPAADQVLTYAQALKYQKDISDLEHTNSRLEEKLETVESDLEQAKELVSQLEEEGETLDEPPNSTHTFIQGIVETVAPIMDRHYDIQENKLQIERGRLLQELQTQQDKGATNGMPPAADPNQEQEVVILTEEQEDALEDEAFFQYRNWLLNHYHQTDQEKYQELILKIKREEEQSDGEGT